MPDLITMAGNAIKAGLKYAGSGFGNVSQEEYNQRLAICSQCEYFNNYKCESCGCFLRIKAWAKSEQCPEGKWPNNIPPSKQDVKVVPCSDCQQKVRPCNTCNKKEA